MGVILIYITLPAIMMLLGKTVTWELWILGMLGIIAVDIRLGLKSIINLIKIK